MKMFPLSIRVYSARALNECRERATLLMCGVRTVTLVSVLRDKDTIYSFRQFKK